MSKTIRFGARGNRVALQDRIDRHVLHRHTNAWYQHAIIADAEGKRIALELSPGQARTEPSNVSFRSGAPGFGRRLPPR